MKKLMKLAAVLSAAVLAVCSASASAFAANGNGLKMEPIIEPEYALGHDLALYSPGDADMDGQVTTYDAWVILWNYASELAGFPCLLTEDQMKRADGDGKSVWDRVEKRWLSVTAADASFVLEYATLRCAGFNMTMEEYVAEFPD